MASGWVRATSQDDACILVAGGEWTLASLSTLDRQLGEATSSLNAAVSRARIDLESIERMDTAGAWLLIRTKRLLEARNLAVDSSGLAPNWAELVRLADAVPAQAVPPPPPIVGFEAMLVRFGRGTVEIGSEALLMVSFLGQIMVTLGRTLVQPWRLRGAALVRQMERTGVDAVPIVGLLSFLIGIVLAFQGADQLRRFGAEIFTVNLLGVSVLRELGVLLTAIIVAGRSGSSFTAQIGAMEVNEEIDALRTIGLDPIEVLVLPRLLGLMLTLPLLTFFADIMAMVGGGLMVVLALDIPLAQFLRQLSDSITVWTVFAGLIKAPVFALLIAMVGCFEGLRVSRSAESVGRLTTTSVVLSIFLVILVDAAFSIVLAQVGL